MEKYRKKICEYLLIWLVGGCLYYTFEVVFRGFLPLEHVCSGRNLHVFLCLAGERAGVERSHVDADVKMHGLYHIL